MDETLSPQQCRAARGLVGMSQEELRKTAKITIKTLSDFESGKTTPYTDTLKKLREALEGAGVSFVDPNGMGAGVRLRDREE